MSVVPHVEIKAGMELFMNYGYQRKDFPEDYPWYWKMKSALKGEEYIEKITEKDTRVDE